MFSIKEVEAEQIFAQRFEPVASRDHLEPDNVLVVNGLIGNPDVLAACGAWALAKVYEPGVVRGYRGKFGDFPEEVRFVLGQQRRLMAAVTEKLPKRYTAQMNVIATGQRVGWHTDGTTASGDRLACATTHTGQSHFQFRDGNKRHGKVLEVPMKPDVTILMRHGAGVRHATRNSSGGVRTTTIQHGYL